MICDEITATLGDDTARLLRMGLPALLRRYRAASVKARRERLRLATAVAAVQNAAILVAHQVAQSDSNLRRMLARRGPKRLPAPKFVTAEMLMTGQAGKKVDEAAFHARRLESHTRRLKGWLKKPEERMIAYFESRHEAERMYFRQAVETIAGETPDERRRLTLIAKILEA